MKSINEYRESYVTIDIETTGLDPQECSIIELSAIRYESGIKVDKFSTLVRPHKFTTDKSGNEVYMALFISQLTGITNEMLREAPFIEDVLGSFRKFIRNDVIVGHNIPFDISFINKALLEYDGSQLYNEYIDTLELSRSFLPYLEHHSLKYMSEYFNVDYTGAHRSLKDCELTNLCYLNLFIDQAMVDENVQKKEELDLAI